MIEAQASIFAGSSAKAATVQPPVPVERWSGVGPGSSAAAHLAKASGASAASSWNFCQCPPMNIAVVPDANARQLPSRVFTDTSFQAADHEHVTLLLSTRNVCAAWLVPVLRPLMPQSAHLAAVMQNNGLIINDRAANARRIATLVTQLDVPAPGARGTPDCVPPAQDKPATRAR